ncbi:MAG: hypothetical protein ISS70_20400 [Phycisphaerae bacterium]|nr:hypothetical protein [Phycisphaerae bacterium]
MRRNCCLFFSLSIAVLSISLAQAEQASSTGLSTAMQRLAEHIRGTSTLNADQIKQQTDIIRKNVELIGQTSNIISEAFDLAASYETAVGPLFMNQATRGGFPRKPAGGLELDRAMFVVQQGVIDHAFTPENLKKYRQILDGAAFETSSYFPGAVDAPADPTVVHEVTINASQPACWGIPVMDNEKPARRPTGCYLAPGSIAEVTVPESIVGRGFGIRVGAHSWDLVRKPKIVRLDRVSIVYPIEEIHTSVANPLGGGIYIEVPYLADAGIVKVRIKNAVRSPFFSARSFDKTTLEQWRKIERHHPGPWADFESDKFMMQVPTKWIYNYDDPVTLMRDWDKSMDIVSELFGLPLIRPKTVLYLQVDLIFRGSANFPGYPQSNFRYNPNTPENGHSDHWLLKGPQSAGQTIFHELGHAQLFTKFRGEVEAVVNLPYVAVLNKGFGVDLDAAFGRSFSKPYVSLDQAAIMWMVTQNFRKGKPMNISNSPANEVRYQHRGYGKYVEIAKLFGWKALEDFWHSVNLDYLKEVEYPRNSDPTDSRILRMSRTAGADLRPLIHFWGIHPEDNDALKEAMEKEGLKPSPLIYDRLVHYKTLIPMNNAEFAQHAKIVNPRGISKGRNPLYGEGWYYTWLPKYEESHGIAAQAALQKIIDLYFPGGRP